MKRWLLVPLLLFSIVACARGSTDDQFAAVCRITSPGGAGSGCVYGLGQDFAMILTAAHVVEGQQAVSCEFWSRGHQSSKLPGQVLVSDPTIDAAVVAVPVSAFGGVLPTAVALGNASDVPATGAAVVTVGCPGGAWASAVKGHITRSEGGRVFFVPAPAGGRSGSVLTNEAGDRIVGIVQVRTMDNSEGGATSIATIRARMEGKIKVACRDFTPCREVLSYAPVQCGPGGCPVPSESVNPRGGRYALPWNVPRTQGGGGANPWSTLPAPAAPVTPPVDLGPITQRLDGIADRIAQAAPVAPTVPVPPAAADPRVDQALGLGQQAHQRIDALSENVKKVAEGVDTLGRAVGPLVAIREKLEADAEAGGLKGKLAQKLLDAGSGDDSLRKVLITAGIVLAIVGFCTFAVIHTMRTGRGPAGTIVHDLAAKHPDNEKLQALDAKFAAIDAKIAAHLPGAAAAAAGAAGGGLPGMVAAGAASDVAQRLRDLEARLHGLALNTPPAGQTATAPASPVNVSIAQPAGAA